MDKTEELAEMVIAAAKVFMEKKLADFARLLKVDERLAAIEAASGTSEAMKSIERRTSRHGDHLQHLERRIRAIEVAGAPPQVLLGHSEHDRQ